MKKIKIYNSLSFLIFLIFLNTIYSQDYSEKITKIISDDKAYLYNLYVISDKPSYQIPQDVKESIKLEKIDVFKSDTSLKTQNRVYNYSFYYSYYKEDIIPLAIEQIETIKEKIDDESSSENIESSFNEVVFATADFKIVYDINPDNFKKFQEYLKSLEKEGKQTYDFSVQQTAEDRSGVIPDYMSFETIINHNHYYQETGDSQLYLQASFPGSSLSITHNFIESSSWIGLNSFGLLVGLRNDPVLNLHEYQNPVWTYGFFSLIKLDDYYIDLNLLIQNKYDNEEIDEAIPVFDYETTEINKPLGLMVDGSFFGKIGDYELPVLNLYMVLGNRDYSNPVYFEDIGSEASSAYFSCSQWQVTTSFFWNTDSSGYNKFKFDVGAGSYDIFKAFYNADNEVTAVLQDNQIPIQPVLNIEYIHDSEKAKFGSCIGYFDNYLTFSAWLKLLEIGPSELRFYERYISEPYGRSAKPWENKNGSNFIQLIYRYGLN